MSLLNVASARPGIPLPSCIVEGSLESIYLYKGWQSFALVSLTFIFGFSKLRLGLAFLLLLSQALAGTRGRTIEHRLIRVVQGAAIAAVCGEEAVMRCVEGMEEQR